MMRLTMTGLFKAFALLVASGLLRGGEPALAQEAPDKEAPQGREVAALEVKREAEAPAAKAPGDAARPLPGEAEAQERKKKEPPGRARTSDVTDPTRATPAFEKTFRELSKDFHPAAADGKPKEKKKLKIAIKAAITGGDKPGSVLVLLENDQLRWLREGGEVSINLNDENLSLRLEKLDERGARLRVLPWNETFILR